MKDNELYAFMFSFPQTQEDLTKGKLQKIYPLQRAKYESNLKIIGIYGGDEIRQIRRCVRVAQMGRPDWEDFAENI